MTRHGAITSQRHHDPKGNESRPARAAASRALVNVGGLLLALLVFVLPGQSQGTAAPKSKAKPTAKAVPAATPAAAQNPQPVTCPTTGQELIKIPEISSQGGRLRAVVRLTDGMRTLWASTGDPRCATQYVRFFSGYDPANPTPWPTGSEPLPGPTLRGKAGDLVEVTFLNHVNIRHFATTLDQGVLGNTPGCDQVFASTGYSDWQASTAYKVGDRIKPTANNPGGLMYRAMQAGTSGATEPTFPQTRGQTVADGTVVWYTGGVGPGQPTQIYPSGGDVMPNCLHGSSTANLHFHGTHTTPSTTGDNVLLFVNPALRDSSGNLAPSDTFVTAQFAQIFSACERTGTPTKWEQLPATWRTDQETLLKRYDATAPYKGQPGQLPLSMQLWPENAKLIAKGYWPQYQLGAYPYCFRLAVRDPNLPPTAPAPFQMGQSPGTHWYHAHKHGSTALNVANGMTGAFIIEGQYDADLLKFYGSGLRRNEKVLMMQQISSTPFPLLNPLTGGPGSPRPPISVNGRRNPVVTMQPGEVQLWRVINGAFRDAVKFLSFNVQGSSQPCNQPGQGPVVPCIDWRQIAQDGVQFTFTNYNRLGKQDNQFNLAPANRADLLVRAPTQPGIYVLQASANEGFPLQANDTSYTFTLLTVKVTGPALNMNFIQNQSDFPQFPGFLADIPENTIFTTRRVVFSAGNTNIDGAAFNPNHVNQAMLLDTAEEWTVMNQANDKAHPFHIHINPFQITALFEPNSAASKDPANPCYANPLNPDTWKPCQPLTGPFVWWDTFAIPTGRNDNLSASVCTTLPACPAAIQPYTTCSNGACTVNIAGYFKMRSRFVDFTGQYVLHCHILIHEDRGMMQLVEVVPNTTLYTHH
jgi:FtsP/CotA-like multicopper oxidase with cupredoxin domain